MVPVHENVDVEVVLVVERDLIDVLRELTHDALSQDPLLEADHLVRRQ